MTTRTKSRPVRVPRDFELTTALQYIIPYAFNVLLILVFKAFPLLVNNTFIHKAFKDISHSRVACDTSLTVYRLNFPLFLILYMSRHSFSNLIYNPLLVGVVSSLFLPPFSGF